jgi:hypothetical protein
LFEVPNMDHSARSLLHSYVRGGKVPRALVKKIVRAESLRLEDDGVDLVPELVLRVLDGLRPDEVEGRPGRKARGR